MKDKVHIAVLVYVHGKNHDALLGFACLFRARSAREKPVCYIPSKGPCPGYTAAPLNCSELVLGDVLCKRDRLQFQKRNHQFHRAGLSFNAFISILKANLTFSLIGLDGIFP